VVLPTKKSSVLVSFPLSLFSLLFLVGLFLSSLFPLALFSTRSPKDGQPLNINKVKDRYDQLVKADTPLQQRKYSVSKSKSDMRTSVSSSSSSSSSSASSSSTSTTITTTTTTEKNTNNNNNNHKDEKEDSVVSSSSASSSSSSMSEEELTKVEEANRLTSHLYKAQMEALKISLGAEVRFSLVFLCFSLTVFLSLAFLLSLFL
jgi:cytoskeletal protein RodZ